MLHRPGRLRRLPALAITVTTAFLALTPLTALRAEQPTISGAAGVSASSPHLSNPPGFGMTATQFNSTTLPMAKQAGAQSVLIGLFWSDIEPTKTSGYNWSKADTNVSLAINNGLEPFMLFTGNPDWAAAGDYKILTPEGRTRLAQMAAAAASRYASMYPGKVRLWSFYNEPDCNGPTALPRANPPNPSSCYGEFGADYALMLKEVYPALKAADPNAQVVLGGVAYDAWGPEGTFSKRFLDDVLANGGGNYFDVMNFHYYADLGDKFNWDQYAPDVAGKTNYLRGLLAAYGVSKPFIMSEISRGGVRPNGSVDLEGQADYLIQGLARGFGSGNDIVIWYELQDDTNPFVPYRFGLFNTDGSIKPTFTAYQLLAQKIGGFTASACPTSKLAGVEAYNFVSADGSKREMVAWAKDANGTLAKIAADQVVRTTRTGQATTIKDADDGLTDGFVSVQMTASPLILDLTQKFVSATGSTAAFRVFLPLMGRESCR